MRSSLTAVLSFGELRQRSQHVIQGSFIGTDEA
jgi:hypothetical protein